MFQIWGRRVTGIEFDLKSLEYLEWNMRCIASGIKRMKRMGFLGKNAIDKERSQNTPSTHTHWFGVNTASWVIKYITVPVIWGPKTMIWDGREVAGRTTGFLRGSREWTCLCNLNSVWVACRATCPSHLHGNEFLKSPKGRELQLMTLNR